MYGGSGKLGRVGGGGSGRGGNRSSFPPAPAHRPSAPSGGRLSLGNSGGPRNRTNTNSVPSARSGNLSLEENFSLVSGKDPPAFAMIVRLTPDLVDEISRAEAQGGAARIKFDSNANNTSGNIIGVGSKDFRFTWSSEMGDLCDIYEERQSCEDGNGLLVESGCAWRKLNVQRILDESTTNHVKMRSEEAERKLKSRKAIVLDHGNPSMKSQMKALAAAETTPWRMPFKQKKEPAFKKRKFEPSQGPPKPTVYKSGVSSTSAANGRQTASPLLSPPDQSVAPASPIGNGIITKSHAIVDDIIPNPVTSKEKIASYEKEIPSRAASTARGTPVSKGKIGAAPVDLRSMLISLLMENPKGMSLKALEKAIGDTIPNSVKKIEPIIKKIATFQAPGRYILKPGIELESFKKTLSESGSSPEYNRHQIPAPEDNHDQTPASELSIVEKILTNEYQEEKQLNSKPGEESTMLDKIDIQQQPPNLLGEKRVFDNSGVHAGSSSNSGSDSDSESDSSDSGSGSQSNSRSKSRSPVGSGSVSSSDSESDASSNSKEGSDEDVDIMTSDDEKEPKHKLGVSEPGLFVSPIPWRIDGVPVQHEVDEKQDDHGFAAVEVERILPNDQETEISVHTKESEKSVKYTKSYSPSHDDYQERQNYIVSLFDEKENLVKDGLRHEHLNSPERNSKSKSKRGFDLKHCDEKSENTKRLKAGSLPQPPTSEIRNALFPEGPHDSSPDRLNGELHKSLNIHMINKSDMVGTAEYDLQKVYNQEIPGKSISDFHQPDQRFVDHGGMAKAPVMAEKPGKRVESLGRGPKYSERNTDESVPMQEDKAYREAQDEDTYTNEKKVPGNIKEAGFSGRRSLPSDSQYKKRGESVGKFKEAGESSILNMESSPKYSDGNGVGRSPAVNGKSNILQRELSDLELGELREPMPEETLGVRKQFERKSSFKQSESKVRTADTWNSDTIKGRPVGKDIMDSGKLSPPSLSVGVRINPEAISKKRTPEHYVEDKTRPQHRATQSQPQQLTRADHVEVGSHSSKLADVNSKFRQSESGTNQGIGQEGCRETQKKAPINELQLHDNKRGPQSKKENRLQPSIAVADLTNGQKEATLLGNNNYVQKRRESSSDEDSFYSKYEKDEPDLKGPIKDFSQYEEYVEEYRDKYDSYCSLDKTLEIDRNHFRNLGKNLEYSKGRDMERYYNLLAQLNDSYHQCGPIITKMVLYMNYEAKHRRPLRHKRLKTIFLVLHEELKMLKQRIKDYALQYTKD